MLHRPLTTLSLLLLAATPLAAQQAMKDHDPDHKVDASSLPAGWSNRNDKPKTPNAKFVTMGTGYHVTSGAAAIYWKESIKTKGPYTAKVTIRQTKAPTHPEAYGIFFAGERLHSENQSYGYLLVRGDGKVMVKHRAGKETHTIMDWTTNAAVNKQDANGVATNTLMVDASRPDSVRLMVNGAQISALDKAYLGGGNGHVGFRVNHNLDVHVDDFAVTPVAGARTAMKATRKAAKRAAKATAKSDMKP